MAGTLWIDVEDLFNYMRANPRPSGIQRVAFEISMALDARDGGTGTLRFVRYDPVRDSFRTVQWPEIARLFSELTQADSLPRKRQAGAIAPHSRQRQFVQRLVYRLPESLRVPVIEAV